MDPRQISHIKPHVFLFPIQFYSKKYFQKHTVHVGMAWLFVPVTRTVQKTPLFCPCQITGLYQMVLEIQYYVGHSGRIIYLVQNVKQKNTNKTKQYLSFVREEDTVVEKVSSHQWSLAKSTHQQDCNLFLVFCTTNNASLLAYSMKM